MNSFIKTLLAPEGDGAQGQTDPFSVSEISDELFCRIRGKSFKDDCTLPR